MPLTESVAHLHSAMLWDFRLLIALNAFLFILLVAIIMTRQGK